MFDIGWTEMLVISVIAIVVVGPKDLPAMLRTVGRYVGKAKRMAREFQTQFDDAVRNSDLDEVRKSFDDLKSANPTSEIGKALSPLTEAAEDLKNTVEKSDLNGGGLASAMDETDNLISGGENSILDSATASAPTPTKPSASSAPKKKPGAKAGAASAKRSPKPKVKTKAKTKAKPASAVAKKPAKKSAKKAATANG